MKTLTRVATESAFFCAMALAQDSTGTGVAGSGAVTTPPALPWWRSPTAMLPVVIVLLALSTLLRVLARRRRRSDADSSARGSRGRPE